jgi:hypothetical protein
MFAETLKRFGVTVSTVINSVAVIVLSLIITRLVTFVLGQPMRPLSFGLAVVCPLVVATLVVHQL